jgi:hypothetical protein
MSRFSPYLYLRYRERRAVALESRLKGTDEPGFEGICVRARAGNADDLAEHLISGAPLTVDDRATLAWLVDGLIADKRRKPAPRGKGRPTGRDSTLLATVERTIIALVKERKAQYRKNHGCHRVPDAIADGYYADEIKSAVAVFPDLAKHLSKEWWPEIVNRTRNRVTKRKS